MVSGHFNLSIFFAYRFIVQTFFVEAMNFRRKRLKSFTIFYSNENASLVWFIISLYYKRTLFLGTSLQFDSTTCSFLIKYEIILNELLLMHRFYVLYSYHIVSTHRYSSRINSEFLLSLVQNMMSSTIKLRINPRCLKNKWFILAVILS